MVRTYVGRGGTAAVAILLLGGQHTPAPQPPAARPAQAEFAPTISNGAPPKGPAPEGMVWIPGGEFSMGATASSESLCDLHGVTQDGLPVHRVYVDGFWMDATEVTNAQFARFVKATGYATVAERTPTAEEFPGALPENLVGFRCVKDP